MPKTALQYPKGTKITKKFEDGKLYGGEIMSYERVNNPITRRLSWAAQVEYEDGQKEDIWLD